MKMYTFSCFSTKKIKKEPKNFGYKQKCITFAPAIKTMAG